MVLVFIDFQLFINKIPREEILYEKKPTCSNSALIRKIRWPSHYTANVNRQTADKLLPLYAIITGENV